MNIYQRRIMAFVVTLAMVCAMLPAALTEVSAADNSSKGSGADALSALGIDTSVPPEGYDPNSIDNPYGRSTIEVTPVSELYTIGLSNDINYDETINEGATYDTSMSGSMIIPGITNHENTLKSKLYGNKKWDAKFTSDIMSAPDSKNVASNGTTKALGNYTILNSGTHNAGSPYSTTGYLSAPAYATTNFADGFSFAMSDVAAGNFNSNKEALSSQVAMVYTTEYSAVGGLYLRFGDAETGTYGQPIELLSKSKYIGNPSLKNDDNPDEFVENFAENPYQLKNYLQVATGDWNGDGTDEVAVYIPEHGNSRIVVYALQTTATDNKNTAYRNPAKWGVAWTYFLREGDVVSNMVSLVSGDVDQDGIDDLACTWGYYYGPSQNVGSRAVVMFGGKGTNILKRSQEFGLSYGTSNLVRASFAFGDLAGSGEEALILCAQSDADLKAGNTYTRYVAMYHWNGSSFTATLDQNFDLFGKDSDDNYLWAAMSDTIRSGDKADKFYSLPLCVSNTAVITRGISEEGGDLMYFDSLIISYGDDGLTIEESWDISSAMPGGSGSKYVEYSAAAGDLTGQSGAAAFFTMTQTMIEKISKTTTYTEAGAHLRAVFRQEFYYKNWFYKLLGIRYSRWIFNGYEEVAYSQDVELTYNSFTAGVTKLVTIDRTQTSDSGYYIHTETVNSSMAICLANTDQDSSYMNYTGKHYYVYTDPKILAVLASPPYFSDLLGRGDLSGNYAESTTSYSSTTGSGSGSVGSTTIKLGAYVAFEQDIKVFGITIASVEAEATVTAGFTWETEHTSTIEQTISYSATSGEDKVAFYSIPMEIYEYTSYVPNGEGGYNEVVTAVNIPHEASIKLLDLSDYEAIAEDYSVLPKISGDILTHTIGDPSTYPSSTNGYDLIGQYNGTPASVGYTSKDGGDTITQEIVMSTEDSNAYIGTGSVEAKAGAGAGGVIVGVVAGFEGGGGSVQISTSGSSFSGELQDMPAEAEAYGYAMNWKIFCYRHKRGGTEFPVVSYLVSDVKKPAPLPSDFAQDIANTTDESITLTWTYDKPVSGFQIYRYYEFPDGSGSYRLHYVPFSAAYKFENGIYYFSYTDSGLSPYTEYSYQIQTESSKNPKVSIYSEPLVCRTKTMVGYPNMTVSGLDEDGNFVIYPDSLGRAIVTLENPEDYSSISYQWQKYVDGNWTNIAGARTNTYTISNAASSDQGKYRCLVNVIYYDESTATNYYISAYSDEFGTAYSKRTPAEVLTVVSQNYTYGSGTSHGIHAEIELHSANRGNTTAPTGLVTFTVTGTDYQYSKTVALVVSSTTKTYGTESKYFSKSSIDIPNLGDGAYTVTYYYSGDRVFKDAQSVIGKMAVIGQNAVGHLLSTADSNNNIVTKFTYGDRIIPTLYKMEGSDSELVEETEGVSYKLVQGDSKTDFIPGSTTPNVGTYTLQAIKGGDVVEESDISIERKPITISVENKDNVSAAEVSLNPPVILCSDLTQEELNDLKLTYIAINTAENEINLVDGIEPSNYVIIPRQKSEPDTALQTLYNNYSMKFISGTYTVIGLTYQLSVSAALYTDYSSTRVVGTAGINTSISPVANYAKGTDVQLYAQPYKGYEVDFWEVNVVGSSTVEYSKEELEAQGKNPDRLDIKMDAAATEVTVYFKIKPITLTATTDIGGKVVCSDEYFASGAYVSSGSEFTFTAEPAEGYHFKQWQVTETGLQVTFPDGTDNGNGTNSLNITMGTNSMGVKALFERDSYTLTLSGDISAYYMKDSGVEGGNAVKTFITGGSKVIGDTEVTVVPKVGYQAAENAVFIVNGEETDTGEEYIFNIIENTTVSLETQRNKYEVTATAENGTVNVKTGGMTITEEELKAVEGGSTLIFTARATRGYHFDHWVVDNDISTETSDVLTIFALGSNTTVEAVFEESDFNYANAEVEPQSRGTMLYTLYDIYGDVVGEAESEMPEEGIKMYRGEEILFKVRTNSGSMVEQWNYKGTNTQTNNKTFPDGAIKMEDEAISIKVLLVPSTNYIFYYLPADIYGSLTAVYDEISFNSGISIPGGSRVVLTAQPVDNYMVDYWTVTDGNTNAVENDALKENGVTLVDPVYNIDGLRGHQAVRVHFTEILLNIVQIYGSDTGTAAITYITPIKATDSTEPENIYYTILRNGGTVVMTLTPEETYTTTVDELKSLIEDKVNEDAVVEISYSSSNRNYTATVRNLTQNLELDLYDLFVKTNSVTLTPSDKGAAVITSVSNTGDNLAPVTDYTASVRADATLVMTFTPGENCITSSEIITNAIKNSIAEGNDNFVITIENGVYTVTVKNLISDINIDTDTIFADMESPEITIQQLDSYTIPEDLTEKGFENVESIKIVFEKELTGFGSNKIYYDITLKYKNELGEDVIVTSENFPENGVDVIMPYPEGASIGENFKLVHMISSGPKAGTLETLKYEKKADGLHFHVNSMSPFAVGWKKVETPPESKGGGGGGAYKGASIASVLKYIITANHNEGGIITPAGETNVDVGQSKTFNIERKTGYVIKDVLVDGTSMGAVTEYTFSDIQANHTIDAVFAKWSADECNHADDCPIYPFKDTDVNEWYHDGIHFVLEFGLMKGSAIAAFAPEETTTRGQIVTILYRLENEPTLLGNNPFNDVTSGSYYEKAIIWASENEIVSGYENGKFGPDDVITREQMAAILYRYAKYKGYDVSVGEDTNILSYNDAADISEYAIPAIQWACGAAIMKGDGINLTPNATSNRAEIATVLQRFVMNIIK